MDANPITKLLRVSMTQITLTLKNVDKRLLLVLCAPLYEGSYVPSLKVGDFSGAALKQF